MLRRGGCTSHLSGVDDSTSGSSPSGPRGARFREKCFPPAIVSIICKKRRRITTAFWFAFEFPSCHDVKLMRKSVNLKVGFGAVWGAKELGQTNREVLIGCDDHFTLKKFCPPFPSIVQTSHVLRVWFLTRKHGRIQVFVVANSLRRLQFSLWLALIQEISSLNVLGEVSVHPSYSLNRLVGDLLPLTTMDARGETKGISIRSYPYARCSVLNGQGRYQRRGTFFDECE